MRPFSLEQAKQGKKVVTRDGREVKQFTMFENVSDGYVKLWGVVGNSVRGWFDGGRYMTSEVEHSLDLFMATEKKTVWVKVYFMSCGDSGVYIVSNGHTDIETLNRTYHDNENYICTKSIEIEV